MTSQTIHGRTQFNRHPRPDRLPAALGSPRPIPNALNPALREHARERAEDGQNRLADARRQVIADQQWSTAQEDDEQNTTLLDVSEQILALTEEVRDFTAAARSTGQHQETREGTDRPSE